MDHGPRQPDDLNKHFQITYGTIETLPYKFLCVRGAFGDENSVLTKTLVLQGDGVLTGMSGVSPSLVPGSGCLVVLSGSGDGLPSSA